MSKDWMRNSERKSEAPKQGVINSSRMAALLERALESGALAFAEPLLEAVALAEVSGRARSEHGAVYDIERPLDEAAWPRCIWPATQNTTVGSRSR